MDGRVWLLLVAGTAAQYALLGDGGSQSLGSAAGVRWSVTNGSLTVPASVPGAVHLDLEQAGVINDTYYRLNQQANSWVRQSSWRYETSFELSPDLASAARLWLVMDGLDTLATVLWDHPPPAAEPTQCFELFARTLPVPRTPFARTLTADLAQCSWACVADPECTGFSTAHQGQPGVCWLYHYPAGAHTSNGTGFNDGDWHARVSGRAGCEALPLLEAGDQFQRYAVPVSGGAGRHNLTVQFQSVDGLSTGGAKWAPVRKEPSNYGYDWAPVTETQGIWLPVYLVAQRELVMLDMMVTVLSQPTDPPAMLQPDTAEWSVTVRCRVNLVNPGSVRFEVHGNWSLSPVGKLLALPAGVSEISQQLSVRDVQLWWPAGSGAQALYTVTASATASRSNTPVTASRSVGFRTFNIHASPGNSSHPPVQDYRVNGLTIFAKGADWVPPDSFESRVSETSLCGLLSSVREANMNFLRIWGGGIFPQDSFFECADRLGIMLEQDQIFSDSIYPTDPKFLSRVAAEVQYQVRRLASHPSLFLWSGSNEEYPSTPGGWWDRVFLETVFPNLTQAISLLGRR